LDWNHDVFIEENAPRDGLQNEPVVLSPEERAGLIDALSACGFPRIQVGSFVNPRKVPQMADTEKVLELIERVPGIVYSVLVLNERGLERALACELEHVSVFVSVSEAHSRRNAGCSVGEALQQVERLIRRGKEAGLGVQAGVMNAFGCRFEGLIDPERVFEIVRVLNRAGADEISLADTPGLADPGCIEHMALEVVQVTENPVAFHLHDTYGFGLANVYAAWKSGIRRFDTACGGVGGCPFIPGAAGNVATEDVVHLFRRMMVETGVDLDRLAPVVRRLEERLGRRLPGRYTKAAWRWER